MNSFFRFSGKRAQRLGFLISGSGSNLQAILEAIHRKKLKGAIAAVVFSDVAKARGLIRAQKFSIPSITFSPKDFSSRNDYEEKLADILTNYQVDYVICAGYMRVLKAPVLRRFPQRILNIHPSLLPSFPGLKAQRRAVEAGVKISGCTVHFVDEGIDTGPIIAQTSVSILPEDTEETLSRKILKAEHATYWRAIEKVLKGVSIRNRTVV